MHSHLNKNCHSGSSETFSCLYVRQLRSLVWSVMMGLSKTKISSASSALLTISRSLSNSSSKGIQKSEILLALECEVSACRLPLVRFPHLFWRGTFRVLCLGKGAIWVALVTSVLVSSVPLRSPEHGEQTWEGLCSRALPWE